MRNFDILKKVIKMDIKEMLQFLHIAENLKQVLRHSWTSKGNREDVAAHSWRMTLMALMIEDEFQDINMNRVLELCVVHDLGEAITEDIPCFEKTEKDENVEVLAQKQLVESVSGPFQKKLQSLFDEMNEMKTKEAKLYKCLDKLEALIQHNEASLDTWLPLERELQMTYGNQECEAFEWMKQLRDQVREDSIIKIKEGK